MDKLLKEIKRCRNCENHLPLGPRPVVQGHPDAKLLIISQAPSLLVHQTGVPWNDLSGNRLREWLGLSRKVFYNPKAVALLPIAFCYPGRSQSGDAPPSKECYDLWHLKFRSFLNNVQLVLLVGNHAQSKYLKTKVKSTSAIRRWKDCLPEYVPLPHPSPRNNIWLHKNPWFEKDVIPEVRKLIENLNLSDQEPH